MTTLKDFLDQNINWQGNRAFVANDHIVTEAIVVYRAVKLDSESDELAETYDYVITRGCSFAMARGIVDCILDQWQIDIMNRYTAGEDYEEGDDDDSYG